MSDYLKIGINGRPLCQNEMRGLARHTLELIKNLHQIDKNISLYVYTYGKIAPHYKKELPYVTFRESSPRPKLLWDLWILPKQLKQDGVKVFHSTNNVGLPWSRKIKKVMTLHDDITHLHRMASPTKHMWNFINYLVEFYLLKKSDRFITISQSAARDISRHMHIPIESLEIIYNGVNDIPATASIQRQDFYLYVGGLDERKNIPMMIKALEDLQKKLSKSIELTIVGAIKTATSEAKTLLQNTSIKINILENISDEKLNELYLSCKALLFSSKQEGFGLPIVEAMKRATPLVVSDIPVFQEITQGEAFFFDPYEPHSLTKVLFELEMNPQHFSRFQSQNLSRGQEFSWPAMAHETLKIYQSLLRQVP